MRLPIDPQADIARRTCGEHWRYLISNKGPVLHLQCPGCTHTWSLDTRPGRPGHGGGARCS
ncbi:hypothetical protein [Streptomyces cyaneofuscatus]|uniref:hypothetical protein n=1 Tax=Streptomyces cyaneofuscatus TaxID=66883 RepID=UPI0037AF651F